MSIVTIVLASCVSVGPSSSAGAQVQANDLLPTPKGALEFPRDAKEVKLGWLVDELSRLTGQELTMDAQLRELLDRTAEPLEFTAPVPAREVYGFVEAMLVQRDVYLARVKGGERPVLGIFAAQPGRASAQRCAVVVAEADLEKLEGHPALLCQIVLNFQNIDTRQLQTQLRQLLVDSTGFQQVVPCGDRSLLLQGSGTYLLGLARTLREVDKASAGRPAPPVTEQRPQPDGPSGPPK